MTDLVVWQVNLGGPDVKVDGVRNAMSRISEMLRAARVEVVEVHAPRGQGSLRIGIGLCADLLKPGHVRPDAVHLHSLFRPVHALVAAAARLRGVVVVVSPHSALSPAGLSRGRQRKALFLKCIDIPMLRRATVACLTSAEVAEVRSVVGGDAKCVVIPNPVVVADVDSDEEQSTWQPMVRLRPLLVSLVRYDVWQKGLDRLAEIARALPEVDIVVHGEPDGNSPDELEKLRHDAAANFSFGGPVHGPDKAAVLRSADLYIQTSRWEGMSLSLLEALALGIPCAVSSYIDDSMGLSAAGAAFRLDDDPVAAARALRTLLDDHEHLVKVGSRASALVVERYSPHRVVADLCSAYRGGRR